MEDLFKNMWENKAFSLSIDYIEDTNRNEMPSSASFESLLEFLMVSSTLSLCCFQIYFKNRIYLIGKFKRRKTLVKILKRISHLQGYLRQGLFVYIK